MTRISFADGKRMATQIAEKKHVWSKYANTAGVTVGLNVVCAPWLGEFGSVHFAGHRYMS
jgi:hypothetical protein